MISTAGQNKERRMYNPILLAIALQDWQRYSAYALKAREVAAALARASSKHLHVLSVYEYEGLEASDLPADVMVPYREGMMRRTDDAMQQNLEAYVAPLRTDAIEVSKILRVGNPRVEIVKVATEIDVDLLIIGSHSKRGFFDLFFSGTAQQVGKHAPCTVIFVDPNTETGSATLTPPDGEPWTLPGRGC
jgi:universal stress protein A